MEAIMGQLNEGPEDETPDKDSEQSTFEPPQERYEDRLIQRLAGGDTNAAAARAVGIHVRTVQRRKAEPGFMARVRRERSELLERAGAQTAAMSEAAVEALAHLLGNGSDQVRLRAAQITLNLAHTSIGMDDLRQELSELESLVAELLAVDGES
jgi:hypothetical protein